jgi:hypothetical protein
LITIDSAFTEITVTDLHETLLDLEDSVEGMLWPHLRNTSGGEELGGGTSVGVTVELQNAQLAFKERVTPLESGTATSNATNTADGFITLTDTAATFETNLVARGDLLINVTDGSQSTVVEVLSETSLKATALTGGTDNDFDISDVYDVYDVVQCRVSGGNLIAVDDLAAEISPIFPTFGTQVLTTASSSATQQEQQDIQYASFNGGVSVDLVGGTAGTEFPTGTERQPVDNFTDALTIAQSRGFLTFYVIGDATIDSGNNYTDYRFVGQGQNLTTMTLNTAANFTNASFEEAKVTGTLDGDSNIINCIIQNLTFVSGVITNCILDSGTITLGGSATAHFINCASGVPGASTPIINCGGSGQPLALRNFNGGIELENKTGADSVSIDMNSGQIILDSTVTNGPIICRGVGKLTDNSVGATVTNELIDSTKILTVPKFVGLS